MPTVLPQRSAISSPLCFIDYKEAFTLKEQINYDFFSHFYTNLFPKISGCYKSLGVSERSRNIFSKSWWSNRNPLAIFELSKNLSLHCPWSKAVLEVANLIILGVVRHHHPSSLSPSPTHQIPSILSIIRLQEFLKILRNPHRGIENHWTAIKKGILFDQISAWASQLGFTVW